MTMEQFVIISRICAAFIPLTSVAIVVWYNRRTIRRMDDRLQEMQRISDSMKDMMLNPKAWVNSRYGKENPN